MAYIYFIVCVFALILNHYCHGSTLLPICCKVTSLQRMWTSQDVLEVTFQVLGSTHPYYDILCSTLAEGSFLKSSSDYKADYNAHTKPLFYASNVLNIHYTYLLEVANFMHDFTRRKLPTPLLNFFSSNLTVHQHNTRQVLDPHFSIIYNSIAEKSILHRGPRIWSNIPQPIKECETKNSFKKLLKRHFLTNQEHLS